MAEVFGQSLSFVLVVAGTALCIVEAFAPGAHFIVLGVALFVAGLIGMFVLSEATPLVLAGIVLAVGMVVLYFYRYYELYEGTGRGQSLDSSDLRGKRGYVVEEVTERGGRVELEGGGFDSSYGARSVGGTIPEGADVVVVDPGGGNIVTVERAEDATAADADAGREPGGTEDAA